MSRLTDKSMTKIKKYTENSKIDVDDLMDAFTNMNLTNSDIDVLSISLSAMSLTTKRRCNIKRRLKGLKQTKLTGKDIDDLFKEAIITKGKIEDKELEDELDEVFEDEF